MFVGILGCTEPLGEELFSELSPETALTDESSAEILLASAYAENKMNGWVGKSVLNMETWTTDEEWETNGGENLTAVLMIAFTWDASLTWAQNGMWNKQFRAIHNSNSIIDNIDNSTGISDEKKAQFMAEARFLRALSYHYLYGWYGPVPIRRSNADDPYFGLPTEDEILTFIGEEFLAVIETLPEPGEIDYGRANVGAARAFLTKFYLNTKQWQKAADMAQEVIDMGVYDLAPNYKTLFTVENDRDNEFIWVHEAIAGSPTDVVGKTYMPMVPNPLILRQIPSLLVRFILVQEPIGVRSIVCMMSFTIHSMRMM